MQIPRYRSQKFKMATSNEKLQKDNIAFECWWV